MKPINPHTWNMCMSALGLLCAWHYWGIWGMLSLYVFIQWLNWTLRSMR